MAELSVSINYRPLSKSRVTTAVLIWGVFGFAMLWLVGLQWTFLMKMLGIGRLPSTILAALAFIAGGCAYIYPPFRLITARMEGSRLIGDRSGLVLPPNWYSFSEAPSIGWNRISSIDFASREDGSETGGLRTLTVDGKKRVKINTRGFTGDELHTLFLALEIWAAQATWTGRATAFRDAMHTLKLGLETASFTQVWEQELKSRFSATTFVPHAPGTTLRSGSLKVTRQLAFGGFSAVYLAQDQSDNDVVLKECCVPIDETDPVSLKSLELFEREAEILQRIAHPQIAKVFDHFLEGGRSYIVLEYISGHNLRDVVRKHGPLSQERVTSLAHQMASILRYLHSQNPPVLHRDFTPDNLVLREQDRLTLVDFGAATELATRATGTLIGKQFYMAAEQMRGKAQPQSDLYALGCTLHFMLTGKEPEALSVCHPGQYTAVSPWLNALVERLTAQDLAQRVSSAQELMTLLNAESSTTQADFFPSTVRPVR